MPQLVARIRRRNDLEGLAFLDKNGLARTGAFLKRNKAPKDCPAKMGYQDDPPYSLFLAEALSEA
jgi:hypothetical protein